MSTRVLRHRSLRRLSGRSLAAGFTLVELMVSLIAGLIIAIAVVGLAKAATTSFHDQVRLMAVEQSVRSASERLRGDLTRVGYMGTGNIQLARNDSERVPPGHKISHTPGGPTSRYGASTQNLQGIRILVGQSKGATEGPNQLATNNGLNPDEIIIAGNMTTDDSYRGTLQTGGSCGGGRIELRRDPLDMNGPVARLLNNAQTVGDATVAVAAAFTPAPNVRFLARVVDARGCQHFVQVRDAVAASANQVFIDICTDAGGMSVLTKAQDGSTCGAEPLEEITVSPLHRVRWYLGPNTEPLTAPVTGIGTIAEQFMMYRQMLDADGNPVQALPPQVVAEYAIDMKFGITVDDPSLAPPANVRVFDLDSDPGPPGGGGNIDLWTQPASTTLAGQPGPQRVRSVKFRVSTRAALPDRTRNLAVLPGTPYLTRYCLENAALAGCTKLARVRTLVSEVALINQARMIY